MTGMQCKGWVHLGMGREGVGVEWELLLQNQSMPAKPAPISAYERLALRYFTADAANPSSTATASLIKSRPSESPPKTAQRLNLMLCVLCCLSPRLRCMSCRPPGAAPPHRAAHSLHCAQPGPLCACWPRFAAQRGNNLPAHRRPAAAGAARGAAHLQQQHSCCRRCCR